uniref:AMIN domain-containing protein n=1 Tax=Aquabacterium sp. TaxID=1872578 RepID=UPI0025B7CDB8
MTDATTPRPARMPNAPAAPHGRRQLLKQALGGTLILALGPQELAWGAQLMAVRVWPANDYTRVTLESDTPLNATFFAVDHPNRLVIDIEGLELTNDGLEDGPRVGLLVQLEDFGTGHHYHVRDLYVHHVRGMPKDDQGLVYKETGGILFNITRSE